MFLIKVSEYFDAAHFLKDYDGKCRNIHGHRWQVDVEFASNDLIKTGKNKGMLEDFSVCKKILINELAKFDHSFIIESGSLKDKTIELLVMEGFKIVTVNFPTTAENFAKFLFESISQSIEFVNSVTVFETPNNCATYIKNK